MKDENRNLLERTYSKFYSEILAFTLTSIKCKEDAEDLVQNSFIRLLKYEEMLQEETIRFFLYTITKNLIIDYFRKMKFRQQAGNQYVREECLTSVNSTEDYINAHELQEAENVCVARLSKQQRLIYVMCNKNDMSIDEVAQQLSISKRTVESHLYFSRKQVRKEIGRYKAWKIHTA